MLYNDTRAGAAVAGTVASLTRATAWQLIDELPLQFDAYHPQGMARVDSTWWISTVDVADCVGLVLAVDDSGIEKRGVKVEIVSADHQNKPDVGSAVARQWYDTDKVDVIVDTPNSGVALAVNQITKD